ncbi:MAG: caspase domain-containing protein, partial [Ruegeria sp.]
MPSVFRLLSALTLSFYAALPLSAADKVALVIGNEDYENVESLWNPENDAKSISSALIEQGFEVKTAVNLTRAETYQTLRQFRRLADAADIAVVYYAGHGIEIGGTNYLVPTDAILEDVRDAPVQMVQLDDVLSQLSGARGLRMVVLDACRNNPFTDRLRSLSGNTRSIGNGLR